MEQLHINIGNDAKYKEFISFNQAFRLRDQKKGVKLEDASYQITQEEITSFEKEILHTLHHKLVTPKFMVTKNIGKGMKKWKFWNWTEPRAPNRSETFKGWNEDGTKKQETEIDLIGIDYDYSIGMVQRDAEENPNSIITFGETLRQGTFVELMNSLMQYRERILFRGTDIPTTYGWTNTGHTGLVNDAGLTAPGSLGTLTTAGGVYGAALILANDLIDRDFLPPFELHMSSGVWMQANKNRNATNGKSDMQFILEDGNFRTPTLNHYLINAFTETNSTGAMAAFKSTSEKRPGMKISEIQNFRIVESYAPGVYALPLQYLEIPTKILWMGRTEIRRPDSIAYKGSLTIDTK